MQVPMLFLAHKIRFCYSTLYIYLRFAIHRLVCFGVGSQFWTFHRQERGLKPNCLLVNYDWLNFSYLTCWCDAVRGNYRCLLAYEAICIYQIPLFINRLHNFWNSPHIRKSRAEIFAQNYSFLPYSVNC